MKKVSAYKAYISSNDDVVKFDEREKIILEKARIFGSPVFENKSFAKTLLSIKPYDSSNFHKVNDIVIWLLDAQESVQMSKD